MLINGEKFACEACVRGHRVSSCHHQDRPLVHVNKKGRPVSQCHHCRGMRKSRSSHIKCECNDKGHSKEDCPNEKGDSKTGANDCCCQHGAKCTCSVKKEHLDIVPEDIPQLIQPKEPHKRPINHNSHESKATVFLNGHHKPVHKFNDAHNHCGAPYKIPSRSHTVHGNREIAQRSTDSLPLPKTSRPAHESPLHNSIVPGEPTRMVKSEHNSPMLGPNRAPAFDPTSDFALPAFDPNAYSYSPFGSEASTQQNSQHDLTFPEQFPESWFMSYEQAHEYEPPPGLSNMVDTPPMDWSNFNIELANAMPDPSVPGNGLFPSQPQTITSFDQFSHLNPGVASSSGEISEADDFVPVKHTSNARSPSQDVLNDMSSANGDDVSDRYRMSSTSSYYGTPQPSGPANDVLDIDDVIRQAEVETRKMQLQAQLQQLQQRQTASPSPSRTSKAGQTSHPFPQQNSSLVNEHPFTVHEAQQYAHMNETAPQSKPQPKMPMAMPVSSMAEDPSWSVAPDMSHPEMILDDEKEDEDWVR